MVKIRLKRFGAKKNPYYRIVVTDSRNAREGAYIESLGNYDPRGSKEFSLDEDRLTYWVDNGAHISPRVASLIKRLRSGEPASPQSQPPEKESEAETGKEPQAETGTKEAESGKATEEPKQAAKPEAE